MKNTLLLISVLTLLFCCTVPLSAQIPNPSFESWTNGAPDNWFANNITGLWTPVTRSSTAHSGNYSVRGDVVTTVAPSILSPQIGAGASLGGFAWTQRSANINGYCQFYPASGSGDRIYVLGSLLETGASGAGVAVGGGYVSSGASTWTQFSIPFTYISSKVPAWSTLTFIITGPTTNASPHQGSYFLLDDLAYSGTTAVNDHEASVPNAFQLAQNYPNPFNPSTTISYSLAKPGFVSLKVYDVLGNEVSSLVSEQKPVGSYRIMWNAAGLSSGVYLYRLAVSSEKGLLFSEVKRLLLLK